MLNKVETPLQKSAATSLQQCVSTLLLSLKCSGEISGQSMKSTYPINSLKGSIPPKIKCEILSCEGS